MKRLSTIFFLLTFLTLRSSSAAKKIASAVSDDATRAKQHFLQERSLSSSRSNNVWNIISNMDEYKTGRIFTQNQGKATFSSFHFLVLPIWWNDETNNKVTEVHDIKSVLDGAVDDFTKQSFKKFRLTYEILPQWRINISKFNPRWFGTKNACFSHVASRGYVQGIDFDGIIMIHNEAASGIFDHSGGGLATVNGDFATMATSLDWRITRHEIGHNFGHYHHSHNHYNYRFSRPDAPSITDGFDMMSGANSEPRSDFGVATKWYYNWVPDESIIAMQPEGGTSTCPSCLKSGTFTIKAFDPDDWWNSPTSRDKLGIHIPIMATYDDEWDSYNVYSYWLSYRGNNRFAQKGLSIHLAYFELADSTMGAWYDSLNFDANGFSDDKADSFVTAGNCYHVSPPGFVMDRDIVSAGAVQPVVCVKSIDIGNSITVTVEFQENDTPPKPSVSVDDYSMSCSSKSFAVDSSRYNLFHMHGMGRDGTVTLSLASTAGNAGAFFFDNYPYSPLVYDSATPYGSMKRLYSSSKNQNGGTEMSYQALFGEVWALLPPWSGGTSYLEVSCKSSKCLNNQYMKNSSCTQCPKNHRAASGSTSSSACWPCPRGTELRHPLASWCSPVENENFLLAIRNGDPVLRTCSWLEEQKTSKIYNTCQKTDSYGNYHSAKEVCPVCCVDSAEKFLLRTRTNKKGTELAKKETCSWLRNRSKSSQQKICARGKSLRGIFPAKMVCRELCGTCSA